MSHGLQFCNMLRYIIGFGGPAEHGKSTCAKFAAKYLLEHGYIHKPAYLAAFAERLKEACKILFRLTDDDVYTTNGKKKTQQHLGPRCTTRVLLQKYGSELGRDSLHAIIPELEMLTNASLWVWNIEQDILEDTKRSVIVQDVRFPDEEKMLRKYNAVMINVVRPEYQSSCATSDHKSETSQSDITFDYTIVNDGSLWDLEQKIGSIMTEVNNKAVQLAKFDNINI